MSVTGTAHRRLDSGGASGPRGTRQQRLRRESILPDRGHCYHPQSSSGGVSVHLHPCVKRSSIL